MLSPHIPAHIPQNVFTTREFAQPVVVSFGGSGSFEAGSSMGDMREASTAGFQMSMPRAQSNAAFGLNNARRQWATGT
jgi:hypothetical protein